MKRVNLSLLTPRLQIVAVAVFRDDPVPIDQIAASLGISVKGVYARLARAQRILRMRYPRKSHRGRPIRTTNREKKNRQQGVGGQISGSFEAADRQPNETCAPAFLRGGGYEISDGINSR